eukprot:TRINITY_DN4858_c0_g1_i3.p1 TRINITY_DN4858_c0_g1~~TRINITY_DN4858_c0_g1_i3.p1  ORF type:complete len:2088 (+),score=540.08 TRINITY_DN4858_c0_g1_i3:67-6264(+)
MSDSEECLEQLVPDSSLNNYDSFGEAAGFGTSNAPTMETGKKSVVKKEGKMAAAVRIVKNMFICNNNKDDVDSEFKKDLSRKLANLEEAWYGGDVAQWDKWVATQEFVKWFKMQEHVFGVEQKPFKEEEWKGLYEAVYGILKILKISLMSDTMESDKRQLITFNNIHLHRSAAFLMFRLAKTTPPEDHNEKKLENLVKELEEVKYEARRHVVSITDFHIVSVGVKVIGQSDNELIESICKFGGTVFSIATGLPGSISKVGEFLKDGKKVIESIIEKVKAEGFITFSTYECFTLGVKCELLRNTVQALTDRKRDGDCLRLAETITSAIKSFHEDVIHDGSLKHADPTHALLWIANLAEMLLFNRAVVRSAGDWTGRISYGKADQKWYQRIPVENDPAATHTVKFPATATDVLLDCLLEFLTFERPSPEKLTEQIKDAKELVGGAVKYQAEKAGKGSVEFIREIDQWYNDTRGQSLESIDGSVSAMTDLLLGKDTSSNTSLKLRCRSVMACYEVIAFEDGRYLTDSQKHDVSEQLSRSLLCDREEVVGALHEALSFKGMKDYMGMTLPTQAKEYKKKISELLDEVDELLRLRGETVMKEAIKPLDKILQNAQRAITVYVRNLEGTSTMVGATMLLTAGILNRAVQIEKAVQDIAKDVSDIHEYLELHRELEDDILRMKHQCERTDEYSFLKVSFSDNTTKEKETETVDGFVKRILGWKNHEEDNSFVFDGNQSGCEEFLRLVEKRLWECYKDKKKEEEEEAAQDLVPVFIYLPKLKDPREKLVEGALKEYGFTVSNIRRLKEKSGEDYKLVLILEGYSHLDREFTFNILRKSNALSEWGDPIILVSANVAFLQYTPQELFGSVDKDGKMMSRCQVLRIEDLDTGEAKGIIEFGKTSVWQMLKVSLVFEKFMKYLGTNLDPERQGVLSLSLVRSFRDGTSDSVLKADKTAEEYSEVLWKQLKEVAVEEFRTIDRLTSWGSYLGRTQARGNIEQRLEEEEGLLSVLQERLQVEDVMGVQIIQEHTQQNSSGCLDQKDQRDNKSEGMQIRWLQHSTERSHLADFVSKNVGCFISSLTTRQLEAVVGFLTDCRLPRFDSDLQCIADRFEKCLDSILLRCKEDSSDINYLRSCISVFGRLKILLEVFKDGGRGGLHGVYDILSGPVSHSIVIAIVKTFHSHTGTFTFGKLDKVNAFRNSPSSSALHKTIRSCMYDLCEEPVLDLSFLRSNVERYFMLSKDMFYEKYPSMSDRNIMTLMFDYNGSLALQMARQQTTIAHYHKRCDLFLEECDLSTFDLEEERRMQFVRDMYASSPLRTVLGPSGKKTFRFVDMWLQYAFTAWAIRDKLMEFPLNRCATRFFVSTFSNLNEKQKEELTHEEQVRVLFSKECHVMQARVADALDVSEQQASEYLVQTCNAACADWDVKMEYLMCFPVVLRQYVAKMASEKCFKDTLYSLLELSKLKFCKVPGAVAMTILSAANEAFAGMDLRGVSVKGAHLDDNTFDRTLLNEDDLKDTCHPRAHLGKFGADGKMKVTSRPLPGLVSFAAMTRRSDEDYVAEVYRDRVRFGGEDIVFSQKIPDSVSSSSVHSRIVWRNGFVVLVVSWVAGGIPHVVDVNMKNNRATKVEECNTSTLAASRIIGITDHGMVWMLNTRLRMKEGIEDSSLGNAKSMCIIKTDKDMGICWVTKAGVLHAGIVEVKEDYPSANSLLTGVSSDRRRTVEQVYPYKHEEIEQNPVWSAVTPMVDKVLAWRRDTQKRWECSVFTLPEETRTLRKHSTFYIDTDIDPATATTSNDVVSVVSKDGLSIHSWVVQRETAKRLYTRSLDLHVNSVKDVRLSETHLHCILVGENNAVISMAIPSAAPFSLGTISRVAVSESGNKVALLVDEGGGSFDLIVRNQELGATSRLYQKAKFAAVLGLTREGDTFSLKAKRQRMGKKLEEKEAYHYEVGDIGLEALELRIGDRPLPCAACDKTREQEAKTMREEGKRVLKEEVAAEQSEELLEHVEYVEKQGKTLVALAGGKAYIWRSISALSEQYGLPDWHETRYKWYFTKRVTMVEEVSVSVPTINAAEE